MASKSVCIGIDGLPGTRCMPPGTWMNGADLPCAGSTCDKWFAAIPGCLPSTARRMKAFE